MYDLNLCRELMIGYNMKNVCYSLYVNGMLETDITKCKNKSCNGIVRTCEMKAYITNVWLNLI
jgi:hypothetical protein